MQSNNTISFYFGFDVSTITLVININCMLITQNIKLHEFNEEICRLITLLDLFTQCFNFSEYLSYNGICI